MYVFHFPTATNSAYLLCRFTLLRTLYVLLFPNFFNVKLALLKSLLPHNEATVFLKLTIYCVGLCLVEDDWYGLWFLARYVFFCVHLKEPTLRLSFFLIQSFSRSDIHCFVSYLQNCRWGYLKNIINPLCYIFVCYLNKIYDRHLVYTGDIATAATYSLQRNFRLFKVKQVNSMNSNNNVLYANNKSSTITSTHWLY